MAALPARPLDHLYTAEEFMALSLGPGRRYELVRGVIKEMSHPGEEHGLVQDNLHFALGNFVRANNLGRMLPPTCFKLPIDPDHDTVRAPDLTFLAKGKVSGQSGAITFPPDLAVEVYSTNDRPGDLREKLEDYQLAGWNLVWVIYPPNSAPKYKAATVEIYRLQQSLRPVKILEAKDELDGEEVIPNFKLAVTSLFEYS